MEVETGKPVRSTRSWFLSIVVAIVLSATVTWFLGKVFHDPSRKDGVETGGCQSGCCGSDTDKKTKAAVADVAK